MTKNKVYQTANFAMLEAYWNTGKGFIVANLKICSCRRIGEDIRFEPLIIKIIWRLNKG